MSTLKDEFDLARPSFPSPVPVPGVAPDFSPVDVPISCYWLPYVAGALKVLLAETTWNTDDPVVLQTVLGQSQALLDTFAAAINSSACDALLPPIACDFDFTLSDGDWTVVRTAEYEIGEGWVALPSTSGDIVLNGLYITRSFATCFAYQIEITYDLIPGDLGCGVDSSFTITLGGADQDGIIEDQCAWTTGTNVHRVITFEPTECDGLSVFIYSEYAVGGVSAGSVVIKDVKIFARGDTPIC